jgi:prepilin signal peptidase PulO-like enzyme (type II secretory pathway)
MDSYHPTSDLAQHRNSIINEFQSRPPALALAIQAPCVFFEFLLLFQIRFGGNGCRFLRNVIPMVLMKMRTRCGLRLTPVKCSIRAAASLAEAGGRD